MHPHSHPHGHPHPPLAADIDGVDPLSSSVLASFRKMMHLNRQVALRLSGGDSNAGRFGRAGVLRVLGKHEGISQRELAEFLHLSPPTVTTMLQKMEQDGLVRRSSDETDQRITRISLTDAGRAQADESSDAYAEYINATVGAMSEDDRRELARLLDALSDHTTVALKKLENPEA